MPSSARTRSCKIYPFRAGGVKVCAWTRQSESENFRLRLFSIVCACRNAITSEPKIKRINPSASIQFAVDKYTICVRRYSIPIPIQIHISTQHAAIPLCTHLKSEARRRKAKERKKKNHNKINLFFQWCSLLSCCRRDDEWWSGVCVCVQRKELRTPNRTYARRWLTTYFSFSFDFHLAAAAVRRFDKVDWSNTLRSTPKIYIIYKNIQMEIMEVE